MGKSRGSLTTKDLMMSDTYAGKAGVPIKLGYKLVPRGQVIAPGFGPFATQEGALGRAVIEIKDDLNAFVEGEVRLNFVDQSKHHILNIMSPSANELRDATDLVNKFVFEERAGLSEDKYIELEFVPDRDATITKANCNIALTTTIYTAR